MLLRKIVKDLVRRAHKRPVTIRDRFQVGRGTYGEPTVLQWGEPATFEVGSFCSIAGGVTILLGGNHRVDWITTYPFSVLRKSAMRFTGHPSTKGDVTIGNDVWIGEYSTILSGVTVGNGAVIGACSVVTKPVPPYAIVVGNPARVVRKRFTDEQISHLERIAWWDWSEEKLDKAMPLLLSNDIDGLIAFAERNSAMA